jgi:dihydroxy-acid dehydratase
MEAGGAPSIHYCTDMCDGIAQGTEAMNLSLASREVLTMASEFHAQAGHFDGVVFISGCDKSVPAHLMSAARLRMPAIFMPGGVMQAGPSDATLDMVGTYYSRVKRRMMTQKDYEFYRSHVCPTAGTCAFLGTANTMQILAEALGMALPGSALLPAGYMIQSRIARRTGNTILKLFDKRLTAEKILTQKAIENALVVLSAISGSTNALLHLPAIAHELDIDFSLETVSKINNRVPVILNVRPTGAHPTSMVWAAGGVPAIMRELKEFLHLDALTVTGKTIGDNLTHLEKEGFFNNRPRFLENYSLSKIDIIRTVSDPLKDTGGLAVLWGNIAPEGAVMKRSAVEKEMMRFTGKARVFDNPSEALEAIYAKKIQSGDAIVIRYQGPRSNGMPEQFYVTEAIASDRILSKSVALITDGRFSGGSKGPCIGHVSPEAASGGPIAAIEDDDLILVDVENGHLDLVGVDGEERSASEIERTLKERLENIPDYKPPARTGLLALYTERCAPAHLGAYIQ